MEKYRLMIFLLLTILIMFTIFEYIVSAMLLGVIAMFSIFYILVGLPPIIKWLEILMVASMIAIVFEIAALVFMFLRIWKAIKILSIMIFLYFSFVAFVHIFFFLDGKIDARSLEILIPFAISYLNMVISLRYPYVTKHASTPGVSQFSPPFRD